VTSDGGFAIVLTSTGELLLIDIQGDEFGAAKSSIQTGSSSQSVTLSSDGSTLYVSTSDGEILVYSFAVLGSTGGAAVEGSLGGFAFVPVDTVFVGENLSGMAFAGRDTLLVVDSGTRSVRVLRRGQAPVGCNESFTPYSGVIPGGADKDTLWVPLPSGAIQVRAALDWTPGPPHHLGFKLYQRTGTNPFTYKMIKNGSGGAAPESLLAQGLAPGTYFFEMNRTSSPGTQIDWTLSVASCVNTPVGVPSPESPPAYRLLQSTPNPFRAGTPTRISYSLAEPGRVRLEVFDVRGARVRTLAEGWIEAGIHEAFWDGTSDRGDHAAAGVYFYRLEVEKRFVTSRRLLLLQ
jgi:hypothetical protein